VSPEALSVYRTLFASFAGGLLFRVCWRGYNESNTFREQQFWTFAAFASVFGVLSLLLAASLPVVVGSAP